MVDEEGKKAKPRAVSKAKSAAQSTARSSTKASTRAKPKPKPKPKPQVLAGSTTDLEDELEFSGEQPRDAITSTLEGLGALFDGVKGVSGAALQYAAGKTFDQASRVINSTPEQLERMGMAGRSLKDLRQVTGVTLDELANAIDLKNPDMLSAIEDGRAALPFEILLRLASFYARNNPLPFILKYARTYNPRVSSILEKIGIDKLVIEAEREMQIVQIYRSRDAARQLSDEGFDKVRVFTENAFDMALHFVASGENIVIEDYEYDDDDDEDDDETGDDH